ncbi:hypothetical protein HK098_002512 [Nowakowskiella sp. JEL0407]|nr:hypothetical protein HK098_002512 [Nowakowskiella sp. JEL0407]
MKNHHPLRKVSAPLPLTTPTILSSITLDSPTTTDYPLSAPVSSSDSPSSVTEAYTPSVRSSTQQTPLPFIAIAVFCATAIVLSAAIFLALCLRKHLQNKRKITPTSQHRQKISSLRVDVPSQLPPSPDFFRNSTHLNSVPVSNSSSENLTPTEQRILSNTLISPTQQDPPHSLKFSPIQHPLQLHIPKSSPHLSLSSIHPPPPEQRHLSLSSIHQPLEKPHLTLSSIHEILSSPLSPIPLHTLDTVLPIPKLTNVYSMYGIQNTDSPNYASVDNPLHTISEESDKSSMSSSSSFSSLKRSVSRAQELIQFEITRDLKRDEKDGDVGETGVGERSGDGQWKTRMENRYGSKKWWSLYSEIEESLR